MKKVCLFFICLMCLFTSVSANGEIPIINTSTETTIQWNWNNTYAPIGVTQLSIDGYVVWNYDPYSEEFILSELEPNTTHTLIIYSGANTSINTVSTKVAPVTEHEVTYGLINVYFILILGIICVVVGAGIPLLGFVAVLFGIIGVISSMHNSFIMGLAFVIIIAIGFIEGFSAR